ncbi:uncharacterized protein [Diadema setosum]|uniref:uncharacterized protein n=1 Tax=Diadema setosum TaxID=31175 RepID=UPI003B3A334E
MLRDIAKFNGILVRGWRGPTGRKFWDWSAHFAACEVAADGYPADTERKVTCSRRLAKPSSPANISQVPTPSSSKLLPLPHDDGSTDQSQLEPGLLTDKVSIDKIYRDLTIVTAFSENHYAEAMGLIGTVQQTMPEKKLVVYDLGIEPESLVKVKQLCNTELRRFPFENYPPHVSNLHTYAWKVIIINITLHEFGAIFWGDASVRFKDSLRHLVPYVLRHHGYMTHFHAFDTHGETDTRLGHIAFFTSPKCSLLSA